MSSLKENIAFNGRAKTVLILDEGMGGKAVITQIVTKKRKAQKESRPQFFGPAVFSKKAVKHIEQVVYSVASAVLSLLGVQINGFDLSVSNISAASLNDVAIDIFGNSADLAVFASMLSAGISASIRDNIVFTGHIADMDGSIRMVNKIPEKAAAVLSDSETDTLIYPDPGRDLSMDILSPKEKERIEGALSHLKQHILPIPVRDIGEVVRVIFTERQILKASLTNGFFGLSEQNFISEGPIFNAARHLTEHLDQRFWDQMYADLSQGHSKEAIDMLTTFTDYYIQIETYPRKAGQNLFRVVASLAPEMRRLKLHFPLLPISHCTEFCRFAGQRDSDDACLFLKACLGNFSQLSPSNLSSIPPEKAGDFVSDPSLEIIISEIDTSNLTSNITSKIDNARASYMLDSVVITSHEDFCNIIASYFVHVSRHTYGVSGTVDMDTAEAEGLEFLERAFAKKGGFQSALTEARYATNGGMRYVLDIFTEQLKHEQIEKHIRRVFRLAFDPLDWKRKVSLMESVIKRLNALLPKEITEQPAEKYAVHYEPIIRALTQSRDKLITAFRSI